MQKWEYLRVVMEWTDLSGWNWSDGSKKNTNDHLNELGKLGWELVSVAVFASGKVWEHSYYLKRPLN